METYTQIQPQGTLRVVFHRHNSDQGAFYERLSQIEWFKEYAEQKGWTNQMCLTISEEKLVIDSLGVIPQWEIDYLASRAWQSIPGLSTRSDSERTSLLYFELVDNAGEVITYRHINF
jgi:hypothetical protein